MERTSAGFILAMILADCSGRAIAPKLISSPAWRTLLYRSRTSDPGQGVYTPILNQLFVQSHPSMNSFIPLAFIHFHASAEAPSTSLANSSGTRTGFSPHSLLDRPA